MRKKNKKIKTKNLILLISIFLLILDIILNFIYIGYKSNIVPIAVIAYTLLNKKKIKLPIVSIMLISVSSLFMVYNVTSNKHHTFKVDDKKVKLHIPSFSRLTSSLGNEYIIKSNNPKSMDISNYFEDLEHLGCNTNYYYIDKYDVTLEGYNHGLNDDIILNFYNGNQCDNLKNNIKHETYKKFVNIENVLNTDLEDLIDYGYTVIADKNYNTDKYAKFEKEETAFIRIISINGEETIISDITKKDGYYIIDAINKKNSTKTQTYMRFTNIEDVNGVLYAVNDKINQKIANIF